MRYRLPGNIILRSENAAKPAPQASLRLREIIEALPHVSCTFDYGCGKLRYLEPIRRTTDHLVVVDSEVQLSRVQRLLGTETSIRLLVERMHGVVACNVAEFEAIGRAFDRGFCVNVLSAIPIRSIRTHIVRLAAQKLRPGACCLFVVQYRNSEFKKMAARPDAREYEDGVLLNGARGLSFYGIIRPEELADLVEGGGMSVSDMRLNDGSAYLWAQTKKRADEAGPGGRG